MGRRIATSLGLAAVVTVLFELLTDLPAGVSYAVIVLLSGAVVFYSLFAEEWFARRRTKRSLYTTGAAQASR